MVCFFVADLAHPIGRAGFYKAISREWSAIIFQTTPKTPADLAQIWDL